MSVLEKLGLTPSEVRVYVYLLENGPLTTGPLTSGAQVSRSKIYEILEKLSSKGLVSYVIRENTKYFEAANPDNLLEYIETKRAALDKQEKNVRSVLSDLHALQEKKKEKQTATVFEGYKGIRTVYNDVLQTLKKGDEYYAYAVGPQEYTKEFGAFIKNYHVRRAASGIKVKLLAHSDLKKKLGADVSGYKYLELRFTDEKLPLSTLVYGRKVFVFTWEDPTAIQMSSTQIADQYRKHFLDIWKRAK